MQVEELHDGHSRLQKLHADWRAQEGRVQRMTSDVEGLAQQVGAECMSATIHSAHEQHCFLPKGGFQLKGGCSAGTVVDDMTPDQDTLSNLAIIASIPLGKPLPLPLLMLLVV